MAIVAEQSWQSDGGDISLTCPAGTTLLCVAYTRGRTNTGLASLDFNGDSLTKKVTATTTNPNNAYSEIWYLVEPDLGAAYTLNSSIADGDFLYDSLVAVAFSGTSTAADPFSNTATKVDFDLDSDGGNESQACTSVSGEMIFDALASYRTSTSTKQEATQVELQTGANYATSYKPSTGASETLTWLGGNANADGGAWCLVSIEPAVPLDNWDSTLGGTGTVEQDDTIHYCGLYSAKITADADHSANPTYISQELATIVGLEYTLTGRVYGEGIVTITGDTNTDTTTQTGDDWDAFSISIEADDTSLTIKAEPEDDADVAYFDCFAMTAQYPADYEHTKFIGTMHKIIPSSGQFDHPITEIEAHDWIGYLGKQELGLQPTLADKTADEILTVALAEFPNQPEDTDFDTGVENLELVFSGDADTSSMAVLFAKLARNEQGRIYYKGDGTLVFEKQGTRAANTTSAFTLDGTMTNIDVSYNADKIYNIVSLRMRTTSTDAAATTELFKVGKGVKILAGETLSMTCNYRDPDTGQKCGGADVVDPETADDFHFGTNRLAATDDKHADISWPSSPVIGGSSIYVEMKNDSAVDGYLNELTILGKRVSEYDSITIESRDAVSIDQVGNKKYSNRMDLIEDAATVQAIADSIVAKYAPSHIDTCRIKVLANITDALAGQLILAEPSTRFTAIESVTGISKDFYINAIEYKQDDTLLWVTIEASE